MNRSEAQPARRGSYRLCKRPTASVTRVAQRSYKPAHSRSGARTLAVDMQCATPPTGRGSASPAPRGPDDAPPASAVPPARPAGAGAWTAWLEHAAPGGRWGGRAPDPSALATEPRGGGDMAPLEPRALVPPKPPGSGRPRAMRDGAPGPWAGGAARGRGHLALRAVAGATAPRAAPARAARGLARPLG